jgi:hypothetical protein
MGDEDRASLIVGYLLDDLADGFIEMYELWSKNNQLKFFVDPPVCKITSHRLFRHST